MNNYESAITSAIQWIDSQMKSFDNGYYGIYERIRIDEHIRTNWCRPDCNAEFLRVLITYQTATGDATYQPLADHLLNWLERVQDRQERSIWQGSFPFYWIDGYQKDAKIGESIYQNDNGKILVVMCQLYRNSSDPRYLAIAEGIADYWRRVQLPDGTFGIIDGKCVQECREGSCFVLWLVTGFYLLYEITGKEADLQTAEKGMEYLLSLLLPTGRCRTSYELIQMENWRPVSSETSIAVLMLSTAYRITKQLRYREKLYLTADYLLSLQDNCGAIRNSLPGDESASQQNDCDLCDLVYTAGFALQAMESAYQVTEKPRYGEAALRLGDFLASIQCKGESPLWDGGWRGSYRISTHCWDGRANQNNEIDEGGMYSVYTGWSCTNIIYGMQLLNGIGDGK